MLLFFAYGIFMYKGTMLFHVPKAVYKGEALLAGHKKELWQKLANITPSREHDVAGVLWEVSEDDRDTLDSLEGYPKLYDRKVVEIAGNEAFVYYIPKDFMTNYRKGRP